jgi:transcriptional regulator with XRE-family HTH domain
MRKQGYSDADVRQMTGLSRDAFSAIVSGRKEFTWGQLDKITRGFGKSLLQLSGTELDPENPGDQLLLGAIEAGEEFDRLLKKSLANERAEKKPQKRRSYQAISRHS